MKLLKNVVGLLVLLFLIECITSNQFVSIVIQRCLGACNEKYCNISVKCRPLNRTSKLYSTDIYFRPGLKLNAPINVEIIAYKKFRTLYRQHMLKVKGELCTELNKTAHPLFRMAWILNITGNILDPCPISGHRYIKPFVPQYDHFPLVPVGEWKIDIVLTKDINNSNEFIASWSEFYEIKPTSAIEF